VANAYFHLLLSKSPKKWIPFIGREPRNLGLSLNWVGLIILFPSPINVSFLNWEMSVIISLDSRGIVAKVKENLKDEKQEADEWSLVSKGCLVSLVMAFVAAHLEVLSVLCYKVPSVAIDLDILTSWGWFLSSHRSR
jgi:hypothetical protein